jgi:hypothetical protein
MLPCVPLHVPMCATARAEKGGTPATRVRACSTAGWRRRTGPASCSTRPFRRPTHSPSSSGSRAASQRSTACCAQVAATRCTPPSPSASMSICTALACTARAHPATRHTSTFMTNPQRSACSLRGTIAWLRIGTRTPQAGAQRLFDVAQGPDTYRDAAACAARARGGALGTVRHRRASPVLLRLHEFSTSIPYVLAVAPRDKMQDHSRSLPPILPISYRMGHAHYSSRRPPLCIQSRYSISKRAARPKSNGTYLIRTDNARNGIRSARRLCACSASC